MNTCRQILVLFLWLIIQTTDAGQLCSSCSGIELLGVCNHHIECNNNEKCYIHQYITESGFELCDLGCTAFQACPHSLENIFGKRAEGHHFKCMSCCNDTALCNQNLSCDANPGIKLPKDCSELVLPDHLNGSYIIFPYGVQHLPVSVYCEFAGNDAWTVIQRRFDGSVNFYRNWDDYKRGFGTTAGEYWLGNEIIHDMTTNGNYELKIVLTDFANVTEYADYSAFQVESESQGYRLSVSGYFGNAGDSLTYHDGMKFSTFDRDNDGYSTGNCAVAYHGAGWYNRCYISSLNGRYYSTEQAPNQDGITWKTWHAETYSLKSTTMLIKKT